MCAVSIVPGLTEVCTFCRGLGGVWDQWKLELDHRKPK